MYIGLTVLFLSQPQHFQVPAMFVISHTYMLQPGSTASAQHMLLMLLSWCATQADWSVRSHRSSRHSTSQHCRCLAQGEYKWLIGGCRGWGASVVLCHKQQQPLPSKTRMHTHRSTQQPCACMLHMHTSHTFRNKPAQPHKQTQHMHHTRQSGHHLKQQQQPSHNTAAHAPAQRGV